MSNKDHHGQDEGRQSLDAASAQRAENGLGAGKEQTLPAMDQNNASRDEKVAGIVAQTRADFASESADRIAEVLGQRFEQAGVQVSPEEVARYAANISH
ncbi:hypothetical protein [Microbacterium sp. NPDC076911]|uniref:hypothetical protein n=1 Tax=Microbacterium sp. NPDC076911 TaxID=3154958 RepID=UPI0034134C5B